MAGPPHHDHHMQQHLSHMQEHRMRHISEMFPNVPPQLILDDLIRTNSMERTITNILEERLPGLMNNM